MQEYRTGRTIRTPREEIANIDKTLSDIWMDPSSNPGRALYVHRWVSITQLYQPQPLTLGHDPWTCQGMAVAHSANTPSFLVNGRDSL